MDVIRINSQGECFTVEQLADILNKLVVDGKGNCEISIENSSFTEICVYDDIVDFE